MAALCCPSCGVFYPSTWPKSMNCPVCFSEMAYYTNGIPTLGWENHISEAGKPPRHPKTGELIHEVSGAAHPDNDECPVLEGNELVHALVPEADLRRLGYAPQEFDVVRLNGTFYELQGKIYTPRNRKVMWWIEPVGPLDLSGLPVLEEHGEPLFVYVDFDMDEEEEEAA